MGTAKAIVGGAAISNAIPGERKGGRAPGQINKRSRNLMERIEREFPGYDPVVAMVTMSKDESLDAQIRLAATVAAAPYLQPKLKPMEPPMEVDNLLPAEGDLTQWSQAEILRVALRARISGDNAAAIAAHRLLADMHGTLKGGAGERFPDLLEMTPEEQEEEILRAAEEIKAKRKAGK